MIKNAIVKTVFLACACLMLCACNAITVSVDSSVTSERSDILRSDDSVATQKTSSATVLTTISATPAETDEPQNNELEDSFVPVLTEDDIEYMGIPYKDLTADQFIQLWAQCTRECNVQRLYVITYDNNRYTDEFTGEPIGNAELKSEQYLRESMQQLLVWASKGFMPYRYSNVGLIELDEAPDGYYDSNNGEELYYAIRYKDIGYYYDYGKTGGYTDDNWITLKKINGYWKIGIQRSSSPPFLPTL